MSSSGLAPRKAASGVPQQKQKQDGKTSRMALKTIAGSWAESASTRTSRASTIFSRRAGSILVTASATASS